MLAALLIAGTVMVGQPLERSEWLLTPQYGPGMELVYKGTYTEESLIPGAHYQRQYSLETIVLIQETRARHWQAALQTTVSFLGPKGQPEAKTPALPGSVRLEHVQIDFRGGLYREPEGQPLIPLNGPPLLETGAFFELPVARVNPQSYWEVTEEGRPLRGWQVEGVEQRAGNVCLKLLGTQQSLDWNEPRADTTGWRRRDLVWFAPQLGMVVRVERTIEQREPARQNPTKRSVTAYDLEAPLKIPGKFFEERGDEIVKARKFLDEAAPLLRQPAQYRNQIDGLLRRIAFYQEHNSPRSPFRKTIVHLQNRLEKAREGEVPPDLAADETPAAAKAVAIGQKVPDFVVSDLTSDKSRRFYDLVGRPTLIVYYQPAGETGKEVLRFLQQLYDKHGSDIVILALAVSHDVSLVRRQHEEMELSIPIMDGTGLHRTFGVDGTPRIVILDAEAVVRHASTGWGYHIPDEINEEIKRCLPK